MDKPNEPVDEEIHFSDSELRAYLNKALGLEGDVALPHDRPNPDPGTITSTELREDYNLSRSRAERTLRDLIKECTIKPAWIYRYDPWPPHKKKKIKGYRLCEEEEGEESPSV